jgi:hypothetical protein
LDFFLKGRASGKPAPAVDVGEVVCAILDVKDKKRSLASLQLACKAWSVEAVMEVLLLQGEHKAKQKAVPALEMAKTLISAVGVLGPKQQAAMLKTAAAAAQMSDPAIRRAALEMLAAMHSHVGEPLLEACAGLMRPPILASLREMVAKAATPCKDNVAKPTVPPPSALPAAVPVASTPIRSRPPSQIPAPVIVQAPASSLASSATAAAAPVPLPAPVFSVEHSSHPPQSGIPAPVLLSGRNPLDEWSKLNGWVESQLRALHAEKQKSETLFRRCQSLESENEELIAVAKELENEASKGGPSVEGNSKHVD